MELRHLRYFAAVAEQLHFRHAAELVHVAQPALSQQIRQLEEEIGVKLFERSRHKVRLTPAGKAFYENTQRILRQVDQAVSKAKKVELGDAGSIRIGFVSTAAIRVLPDAVKKLQKQAPSAEVELNELSAGEQIDGLYREQLDIGFLHAKLSQDILKTKTVARDRLVAAVPAASKLAGRTRVDLKIWLHGRQSCRPVTQARVSTSRCAWLTRWPACGPECALYSTAANRAPPGGGGNGSIARTGIVPVDAPQGVAYKKLKVEPL